ncbi:hypothetical protein OS493_016459 [Desmophyllum pertusum]|uniref:Uncharacterized protein n=1 Tax=Desmophyllum pertusum TaxID=174260 RepID=A0A9X0D4H1_9CNID|nr:hypothetical protein OS493_016459 [Desmophyllum pertusum]
MASGRKEEMLMEEVDLKVRYKYERSWITGEKIAVLGLIAVGVVLIIIGIVLLAMATSKSNNCAVDSGIDSTSAPSHQTSERCEFSAEAKRIGLDQFVKKNRTDISRALFNEISYKKVNSDALKPRERKTLAQVEHYLKQMFGQPYDVNYYAGDWMMGPNLFCWQPICYHGYDFYNGIIYHRPYTAEDVELIRTKLETHKKGILQYIDNMKMGIRKGMVRNVESCVAGTHSVKRKYLNVSLYNETGIWKEWFAAPLLHPDFYSNITKQIDDTWKKDHGRNVSDTVKEYLLTYLGKPLHQLIRFLEDEYIHYCVPSSVSSGLGSLPLKYVWYDGKENKSWPTDPTLPSGEKLNGRHSYSLIMPFFTTNDMEPAYVHELGKTQLNKLYPMVVEIAKDVMGVNDSDQAVALFRQKLNSTDSFFNDAPIPKNETDEEAHKRCSNLMGAETYCPKRWAAMQLWFREARRVG